MERRSLVKCTVSSTWRRRHEVRFSDGSSYQESTTENLPSLVPDAQRVDNAIQLINQYLVDSALCSVTTYPIHSNLAGGYHNPHFEPTRPWRRFSTNYHSTHFPEVLSWSSIRSEISMKFICINFTLTFSINGTIWLTLSLYFARYGGPEDRHFIQGWNQWGSNVWSFKQCG